MKRLLLLFLFLLVACSGNDAPPATDEPLTVAVGEPDERLIAAASTVLECVSVNVSAGSSGRVRVEGVGCEGFPTPTPEPTPTSSPEPTVTNEPTITPEPTPVAGELCPATFHDAAYWHPTTHPEYGCYYGHEHGDEPPAWVSEAGYEPGFTHHANTPNENTLPHKHTGFKGYSARLKGVDIYGIFHMDFNPGGHVSRFHSYQIWARDGQGGVSHWHGWLDFGEDDNTGPNFQTTCGDQNIRPIILANDEGCPIQFETWYSRAAASGDWSWDFGFSVSPNYYAGGDPANPATWVSIFGFANNLTRRMEAAWYPNRSTQRDDFWATQFGVIVTGENDPVCGTSVTYGARTYTVLCLPQHIANTMTAVQFPNNAVQKTFPDEGVELPN